MVAFAPKTKSQERFLSIWEDKYNEVVFQLGYAGTGKSTLTLFAMMRDVLTDTRYKKIIIVRSAVESRKLGALPGELDDKLSPYEAPYRHIIDGMFKFNASYDNLKALGKIEFVSTTYLRGLTFDNALIIVDEMQNMDFEELDTIMTRVGLHTRIVFCGDAEQCDLQRNREVSGLSKFLKIHEEINSHNIVEYSTDDILRSGLVRDYLIAKHEMKKANLI